MAKILVVDDDDSISSLICQYLNSQDFEVDTAHNSVQARHCLENSQYDAILSDFQMPGESGLDLLYHVSSRFPGLPFILMTGSHSTGLKQQSMQMGCSGYLEKPLGLPYLLLTIRTVLSYRQMPDKTA
ncbi:hypothetical protein SBDP1_720005 [Syntrophobacter sp. SbD1]|nr:hypothetical protein SBDP1_720005 [Syntrophobacter sp. SbD1]